jgi:Family of unknown function (DUF6082)
VALAIVCSSVLLSPVLLKYVAARYPADWMTLSDVGQTYQAASAILSALALAAVAGSLVFQARQATGQQIQTVRGLHFQLTKMALDEPGLYLPCWRPLDAPTIDEKRQHLYENLVFSYMWMAYELTGLQETEVRSLFRQMFKGEVPQKYWKAVRAGWTPTYMGSWGKRRARRFTRILDEEYERALRKERVLAPSRLDEVRPAEFHSGTPGNAVTMIGLIGLIGGVAIGAVLGRRKQ